MKISVRAAKLREQYFNTLSTASLEFPYWYSRKYDELNYEIPVVRRAEALKCAFSNIPTTIWPDELLIGSKTADYRGSFPMPWLSAGYFTARAKEFLQAADLAEAASDCEQFGAGGGNVTQSFGKVLSIAGKFGMRAENIPALVKLAENWENRSVEDLGRRYEKIVPEYQEKERIMESLICMFDSGYTLPQGREVINYFYPLQYGYDDLIEHCEDMAASVAGSADGDGIVGMDRLYFYIAAKIVLQGIQQWYLNYAREARRLAGKLPSKSGELLEIAAIMEHIAHKPPETFRQALQLIYLVHIAALNEDAISGLSPGRIGQVLYPYFEQDSLSGRITETQVIELLECYRVKMTCIDCFASTGVVGGVLSGNTFNNVCVGGLTKDGQSAENRLEELIIETGMSCQTTQPTLTVLYDEKLSEGFLLKAAECVKTGVGYPAWVNNRNAMDFLLKQYGTEGMTLEEARSVAIGGCLETSPCCWHMLNLHGKNYTIPGGAGQPTSVGVHFIANPKVLELVLNNGYDERTARQVLQPHNHELADYSELWQTFCDYYEQIVDVLVKTNNIQHDIWRKQNMAVYSSLLKPDCLEIGQHIGNMGYRYNATYNVESCGQVNTINSLAALKKLVYEDKKYTLLELREAMKENFGYMTAQAAGNFSMLMQKKRADYDGRYDEIHFNCKKAPKFGNANQYTDELFLQYEQWFCEMCRNYQSLYAEPLYACQISVSTHGAQGMVTQATPDGRLSGTTFADGSVSAYPGTDTEGVYALMTSATCWDQPQSQNSQLNLKLHPTAISGRAGTKKLLEITRAYLRKGGFHVQYNVVDSKTLLAAQAHPEEHRELMVRVAGFTQYWVEISKPIQDEVIARTQYEKV
ncbi:MAG: 4-hydroxyphenylacetate decarboxylase large subunit [Negativicutes bacterium]|jgi:4-hydroxyphenylacetate decarboxylase large subunit